MLRDLKNTYKIYIYTMGTRPYAEEVKKILDPDGDIFGNRVLSRCDTPGFHFKLLSKLKLHDDNALIIDDTPEVWKRHRRNLLQIERYMYFPVTKGGDCYFLGVRTRSETATIWRSYTRPRSITHMFSERTVGIL
jgi:hypothetical protein